MAIWQSTAKHALSQSNPITIYITRGGHHLLHVSLHGTGYSRTHDELDPMAVAGEKMINVKAVGTYCSDLK